MGEGETLPEFIKRRSFECSFEKGRDWSIMSDLEQNIKEKVAKIGKPLGDPEWGIKINFGIKTGFNEAFIIDGEKREELIKADPKNEHIIRPILRGRDIERYRSKFADKWLIFIPWHFPLHGDRTIRGCSKKAENLFEKEYPAIHKHLSEYKNQLLNRNKAETGIRYEWYSLQRWGANYSDDFSKQKIVWKRIGSILRFSLDEERHTALDSTCFATGSNLKYVCSVLNSKMGRFLLNQSPKTGTGDYIISVQAIEPIKIPMPKKETIAKVEFLFDKIFINLREDTICDSLLEEMDGLIFDIFQLNEEEISFVSRTALE
jgi:hypothetical protein